MYPVLYSILSFCLGYAVFWLFRPVFKRDHRKRKWLADVGSLNENLEKRILEEVKKNREKDLVLIQQSKMASIGELLTSMGHQWVQAINSLSLLIQDVREALEFGEVNDDYIDLFINESMAHINLLTRTMNDYRDFYRPAKDKVFFPVGDSIEEALSIFGYSLNKHNIHVEFKYGGKQTAYGFPNEYSQAVLNILTYIRDVFLQSDTKKRTVTIKIAEDEKELTTELFGNTGGIEQETLEKIFDSYFSTAMGESGLGLYMAKIIVENMNGHFNVENMENGVKFSLIVTKKAKEKHSDPVPAL